VNQRLGIKIAIMSPKLEIVFIVKDTAARLAGKLLCDLFLLGGSNRLSCLRKSLLTQVVS
jgi:hypothetical protein